MMGGMSGMGDMSGIMNGFIDLIIDFFEGLKNMFNGESTGEGNNDNAEKEYLPVAFPNADNAKKENLPGTFPDSNTYWKKEL